jgi:Bacterial EndoU nuclease
VHLNGRVYDPLIGKFLSGDPMIGQPENGQNYNRYSYVLNNPMNMTDPTGYQAELMEEVVVTGPVIFTDKELKRFRVQDQWETIRQDNQARKLRALQRLVNAAHDQLSKNVIVRAYSLLAHSLVHMMDGDGNNGSDSSPDKNSDKPSLLDDKGETHILDGDGPDKGGGHRAGTGKPGKSEFPGSWSDEKILGEVSDVATDPNSVRTPQQGGRIKVEGTRDGVDITVIVEPGDRGGRIVTGYPTNTPRNP